MSDVVLRCPNCGTTQAAPGECDACHESDVRYFCTNHSPGRWLDGPVCAECALRPKRERVVRPTPPRRENPPLEAPIETPRRTPTRERGFEDRWKEPRDPEPVDPLGELEATIGRYLETARPARISAAPVLGCVGQLIKVAVFLLILLALGTCWFFGGLGVI